MKTCRDCGETKPLTEFGKHKTTSDGRNSYCRPCMAERCRAWRLRNHEAVKQREADNHLLRKYGITRAQYDAMLERQGGRCLLCLRTPEEIGGKVRLLCVDHDHETNEVRGLLCRSCNAALHPIESFDGWVDRALAYLTGEHVNSGAQVLLELSDRTAVGDLRVEPQAV